MEDQTLKEKVPPRTFHIHNTSRSRFNRTQRAAAPEHGGMKQYIGGEHRLVRGRPLVMTEAQIQKHLPELVAKKAQGLIDVKTADGLSIDLKTGRTVTLAPPPAPLPNPPLDSIQNDKPAGLNRPQIAGGLPEMGDASDPSRVPDLVAGAISEDDEDEEDDGAPVPDGSEPSLLGTSGSPTPSHGGGKKKKGKR